MTFVLGRTLLKPTVVQMVSKYPKFSEQLKSGESGWHLVLLLRLSPVPSYVVNYGIAAVTDVPFAHYIAVTAVANLPMVMTNVFTGACMDNLKDVIDGKSNEQTDALKKIIFGVMAVSCGALFMRVLKAIANARK